MNIRMMGGLACASLLSSVAIAQHAVNFDHASGLIAANFGQSIGWQFDVTTSATVTHMTWYDEGMDGLVVGHEVGLWDGAGNLLATTTIGGGTSETLDGQWRVVDVADVVLAVGTGYIVGGYNPVISDVARFNVTSHVVDSRLSYVDATFSGLGASLDRPTFFAAATTGIYGPSFKLAPVPEPATMAALGIGALAMIRRRRA